MYRFFSFLTITLLLTQSLISAANPYRPGGDATFVWTDDHGEGRNLHVFFRQEFTLDQVPEKAELNVFADSRYILYINGTSISYGPARAFLPNPMFDTYDLAPYLRSGDNVVAVLVRSNGTQTYQLPLSVGGFIAWGEIVEGNNTLSLETPGTWKAFRSDAWHPKAPKMSFAAGPIEMHDGSRDPKDWMVPGFDDSQWMTPVVKADQNHWGDFHPRNIPFLTHDEILAKKTLWKRTLDESEDTYSFRLRSADRTHGEFQTQKRVFAYTYIYSPKRQKVEVGTWWGEYFLNGEGPLERFDTPVEMINRETMTLDLKRGWNFFFIKYDIVWASWEFYMAVDKNAGLVFSPDKHMTPQTFFRTAGPFTEAEEDMVWQLPLPFKSPDDLPALSVGWIDRGNEDHANKPAWNVAWSQFGDDLPSEPFEVMNIEIKANQPSALAFELGGKRLGRIFIEYEAPAGTRFDFGFSEDLVDDRPWVLKRAGVFTAASHIAGEGTTRFETFKPYGLRYIQVNITGHTKDVKIKRIGVINQIYPFELNGGFASSDPMMDAIWSLGWRTLLVCAEDTYTDTPFRERGLYAGDALPQYAITLVTSGDSRLIKRSLEVFQDHYASMFFPDRETAEGTPGNLGDFPMITLEFFRWYVQHTGDLDFARRLYEPYQTLMEGYRELETFNGLYIFPRVFIEWTLLRKDNTANTAANTLMVRSYRNLAWLARQLDKQEDALRYDQWADEHTAVILELCWDDEKGAFIDGYFEGEKMHHHYPISSAYPIIFGLTNDYHHDRLRPHFAETLADIKNTERAGLATPYGGFYVLGALYKIGEVATAERFIRQYWSPMIIRHNDTAWENFSDHRDGVGQGTLSHAWSGGPTFYMSTQVLGVQLMFPDFENQGDELVLAPQSESINHASGVVPHPKGPIRIDWHVVDDLLFYDVDAPEGLQWRVEPNGRLANKKLIVNGNHVFRQKE